MDDMKIPKVDEIIIDKLPINDPFSDGMELD